ncbi:MAG: hypothetical protein CL927_07465 [Deltaproteobacteria bacterium]|nr:hypothetical protein [Deltaproteobacteria bacterium]HCH64978.1 hypothetical protein [Deltaproteobacteria bacterium]
MPSEPSRTPMDRELRSLVYMAGGALLAVLTCLLLAGLYIGQALDIVPSNHELTRTVREHTSPVRVIPTRIAASVEKVASVEKWCGEVHFLFRTPDGQPVQGEAHLSELHLPSEAKNQWHPLDEEGRLTVSDARCSPEYSIFLSRVIPFGSWFHVETVPDQDTYVIEVGALGEKAQRRTREREICPLRVVFEDADGEPALVQVRMPHVGERDVWIRADPDGSVEFPDARCTTRPRIWMKRSEPRRPQMLQLERHPDSAPELVVSLGQTATVRAVDASGQPLEDAVIEAENIDLMESGDYRVTDFGETTSVVVRKSDSERKSFEVPLDGALHELQLPPRHQVDVTLMCDQCAGAFFCGKTPCTGEAPHLQCSCPNQSAELGMQTIDGLWEMDHIYDLLAVIPPEVDALTVEIRGERASVRLQVEEQPGLRFSQFSLYRNVEQGGIPDRKNAVRYQPMRTHLEQIGDTLLAEEVLPGAWTLFWQEHTHVAGEGWQEQQKTLELFLNDGEALDLGVFSG